MPGNSRCQQELRALQTKVGMPLTAHGSAQRQAWTKAQIHALTAQRVASEVEAKKRRLHAWRTKVAQSDRALSRWFKAKESSQWHLTVRSEQEQLCDTPEAAAAAIAQHWRRVAQDARCQDQDQAARVLAEGFRLPHGCFVPEDTSFLEPAGTSWPGPALPGLTQSFRRCKGSAGVDGWDSAELKHIPDTAISTCHVLFQRWHQAAELPTQMLQARQVCLAKASKVEGSTIAAQNTRPITVMSCFWRIYMNSWLSTPEIQRCRNRLPKCVFGSLTGLSAEETAVLLQDRLAAGGILSTLDLSQAYDRMSPAISQAFLTSLGWDRDFCQLWATAWAAQQRYVQWQDTTLSNPLVGLDATPQGCPLAPLVLGANRSFARQDSRHRSCKRHIWMIALRSPGLGFTQRLGLLVGRPGPLLWA